MEHRRATILERRRPGRGERVLQALVEQVPRPPLIKELVPFQPQPSHRPAVARVVGGHDDRSGGCTPHVEVGHRVGEAAAAVVDFAREDAAGSQLVVAPRLARRDAVVLLHVQLACSIVEAAAHID